MTSPSAPDARGRRARRWLRGCAVALTATTAAAVLVSGAPVRTAVDGAGPAVRAAALDLVSAPALRRAAHPHRRVVVYRVRPGDTATGLAVRFHAWTDELRALNHLGRHGTLYVGERIRIPVVPQALRPHHRAHHRVHHRAHHAARHHTARHPRPTPAHHPVVRATPRRPWALAGASRGKVRRVVMRIAAEHHLGSRLALAVAWQESGWQQHRVSSAGAIGVMQVLPGTARWMSSYVGRPLNPYGLYDNVTAGVVLLTVLRSQTAPTKAIGAYFQGLGSVQRHGLQRSTKAYVRSVLALRRRIAHGWNPA